MTARAKPVERQARLAAASAGSARHWGYISHWLLSREECLIHILAHEIRHVWQVKHKKEWMRGSKGRNFSEGDADAFAIRIVRAWRWKRATHDAETAIKSAASFLSAKLAIITKLCRRSLAK